MSLFKKIFGCNKADDNSPKQEDSLRRVPVSEVNPSVVPGNATVIYETKIPESCSIGNLVYEKKYQEAIDLGLKLLEKSPNDGSIHIDLMDAYFKGRALAPDYLDKSTYHAKQAILCGHDTGYAEDRLAKNLDKAKQYHQSLQLYSLILDNEAFHFSEHGMGNSVDFAKRRTAVLKKINTAADRETDVLFTPDEIARIIKSIKDNETRAKLEKERHDRLMAEMQKALNSGDYTLCDKLLKELHEPIQID